MMTKDERVVVGIYTSANGTEQCGRHGTSSSSTQNYI